MSHDTMIIIRSRPIFRIDTFNILPSQRETFQNLMVCFPISTSTDTGHNHIIGRITFPQFLQRLHFRQARGTDYSPEININHFARILFQKIVHRDHERHFLPGSRLISIIAIKHIMGYRLGGFQIIHFILI